MTDNGDVLLQQTEDGHHKFVDAQTDADTLSEWRAEIKATRATLTRGSKVQLISGGPIMTVEGWASRSIGRDAVEADMVELVWFDASQQMCRDQLHYTMLKLAEPQEQK